jgi:hypothetical protein
MLDTRTASVRASRRLLSKVVQKSEIAVKTLEYYPILHCAYPVLGVNNQGTKGILGIWIDISESASVGSKYQFPANNTALKAVYFSIQALLKRWKSAIPQWGLYIQSICHYLWRTMSPLKAQKIHVHNIADTLRIAMTSCHITF